jgi:hypothetical protein
MDRLAATLLACCLLASGCAAAPTTGESGGELSVSVANGGNVASTVTVSVVPPDVTGVTITYVNGTRRRFDVSSVGELSRDALADAAAVTADAEGARVEEFRVGPGEAIGATFDVPQGVTVVHVVQQETGVRAAGVGTCSAGADVIRLSVTVRSDGDLQTGVECLDRPQDG